MPRSVRTRASNCILLTIVVVCICNLIVFGVIVVREYAMASGFEGALCLVDEIKTESTRTCRFCGNAKDSKKKQTCQRATFPCLKILVRYSVGESRHQGLLHSDSLQAAGEHSQCSFTVCRKHFYENKEEVDKYANVWREKQTSKTQFKCYYNTEDTHMLIAEKMHTRSEVIHTMLWPSLIIFGCGFIFIYLEMRRRGIVLCAGNQPSNGIITCPYSRDASNKGNSSSYHCGNGKQIIVQLQKSPDHPHHFTSSTDALTSSSRTNNKHHHHHHRTRHDDKTISRSTPALAEMLIAPKTPPGSCSILPQDIKSLYTSASVDHIHSRHSIGAPTTRAFLHPKSAAHARDLYQNRTRSLDVEDKGSGVSMKAMETPV